jgi:DUF4097 and DUF4098 domain-containing protein YvlB
VNRTLVAAAALAAALSPAAAQTRSFKADGVRALKIEAEAGDVEVRAGKELAVEVTANDKPERCALTLERRGDALFLKAESVSKGFSLGLHVNEGCGAGFRVTAPAALSLDASVGSGKIAVTARRGALVLRAGSGDVTLDGVAGDVDVKTGSGGVAGAVLGRVSARTGSGDVKLTWSAAPEGRVDVKTGSGDVALSFPKGTKLRASQVSGSGTARNGLGDSPDAKLAVSIVTGSGNSTIEAPL